jgi:predicted metal-dependent phosphoesterase TrpH
LQKTQQDDAKRNPAQAGVQRIKVDLHVHTCYSKDSLLSLEEVIAAAQRRGLGALAVLGHNTIDGALALRAMAPFPVIVGEEVFTTEGEVAGLFVQEVIPPGLTPAQTVERIQEQGGLVYVPHPFDSIRRPTLRQSGLMAILDQVDAIEVLNARVLLRSDNERAKRFAQTHRLPAGAGSDAHAALEIGQAYVEMEPFTDRDSFLRSLASGQVCGGISSPLVHLFTTWAKIRKRMRI